VADYPSEALQPGTAAPDFQLKLTPDQSVRLADFRGRALIMAFYPADWPKGEAARRYGVYDDEIGMSERALFVVDPEGVIHWSYVSPIGVNPGADGILAALESMAGRAVA
jgi:peroxiredoxin